MKELGSEGLILDGVQEYCEGMDVLIINTTGDINKKGCGRLVINAKNEAGYNSTEVDLLQLIEWIKANMPELIA